MNCSGSITLHKTLYGILVSTSSVDPFYKSRNGYKLHPIPLLTSTYIATTAYVLSWITLMNFIKRRSTALCDLGEHLI